MHPIVRKCSPTLFYLTPHPSPDTLIEYSSRSSYSEMTPGVLKNTLSGASITQAVTMFEDWCMWAVSVAAFINMWMFWTVVFWVVRYKGMGRDMNGTLMYFLGPPLVDNLMRTLCEEEEEIRRDTGSSDREGRMPPVAVAMTTQWWSCLIRNYVLIY